MGNLLEPFFPTPKEEFPPTGVKRVDEITNNVKQIIATVNRPEEIMNEWKYRTFNLQPPSEVTALLDDAKAFAQGPQNIIKKHLVLFEDVPKLLQNPALLLQDPQRAKEKIEAIAGAPEKIREDYTEITTGFKELGDNSMTIVGNSSKYVEDYKKTIDEEYQKALDYLHEVPKIVPILVDSVEKLNTFEENLKQELTKFSGGLCSAARSLQLIKHNLTSLQKYKKKYEEEIAVAQGIAGQAIEKAKEVEKLLNQGRAYQKQAEETLEKIQKVKQDIEEYQKKIQEWKEKFEDLQRKQGAVQAIMQSAQSGDAKEFIGTAFSQVKNFF